jgi:hypothetical protein
MIRLIVSLAVILLLVGCDIKPSSRQIEAAAQERASLQAAQSVGMPAIVNWQEKRVLKQIFELRDTTLSTITYIIDFNGRLHKVCDSVGYGIPYATQFTNPQMIAGGYEHGTALPQADPNGLFSPASADGTWVQCLDPATKKVSVLYIEPRVLVSPFPLTVN